jgi:hypothetical protein
MITYTGMYRLAASQWEVSAKDQHRRSGLPDEY